MKTLIYSLLLTVLFIGSIIPQKYWERRLKDYNNPDELVTLSQSLPFNEAIALLSKVSESTTGKKIVSTANIENQIEIESMPYDKALFMIVQYAGLMMEEKEDVIVVKRIGVEEKKPEDVYASVDSREVKISAVFFEVDVAESRKLGIDWKVILSGRGINLGAELLTESQQSSETGNQTTPAGANVNGDGNFDAGNFYGEATALFRFFEDNNLGEIIASPNITVRDNKQGRIQVGSDFSVRTRDFAGNTVEKFFPTGTIIEVTPHVYKENKCFNPGINA